MSKLVKKELEDEHLLENTRDRVDYLYENYEAIFVANSGGKDSMSVFNVMMDGWERNKEKMDHPVMSIFHDFESAPFPETIDLLQRSAEEHGEATRTYWCVVPFPVSCMTHPEEREWNIPWNEEHAEHWVREMPTWIDEYDNIEMVRPDHELIEDRWEMGDEYVETAYHVIDGYCEKHDIDRSNAINLVGLRAEESMNRYTTIINNGGWIAEDRDEAPCHIGYPVYDWGTDDLWKLHREQGWDYTGFYDKAHQMGIAPANARNGSVYGAHPIRAQSPKQQRHFWPERFVRWERRQPGATLAFEFGYDIFDQDFAKPDELSWEEFTAKVLNSFDDDEVERRTDIVENRLESHWDHSDVPLKETESCPVCDLSWEQMARDLIEWLRNYREDAH